MVALGLIWVTVALGQGSLRAPPSSNLLGQVCLSPPEWTKGEAPKKHQPNTGPLVMAQRGGEMKMYHRLIGDPGRLLILPAPRLRSVLPWRRHLSMRVTNVSSSGLQSHPAWAGCRSGNMPLSPTSGSLVPILLWLPSHVSPPVSLTSFRALPFPEAVVFSSLR